MSITNGITGGVSLGNVNCGNNDNPIGADCITIGNVEAYAYKVETTDWGETTIPYNAISIASITSHIGNGISSGTITAGSTGISSGDITCGTSEKTTTGNCVSTGNVIIYGTASTSAISTDIIYAKGSSRGIKVGIISESSTGVEVTGSITATEYGIKVGGSITAGNAGISSGAINCGTSEKTTTDNCV